MGSALAGSVAACALAVQTASKALVAAPAPIAHAASDERLPKDMGAEASSEARRLAGLLVAARDACANVPGILRAKVYRGRSPQNDDGLHVILVKPAGNRGFGASPVYKGGLLRSGK